MNTFRSLLMILASLSSMMLVYGAEVELDVPSQVTWHEKTKSPDSSLPNSPTPLSSPSSSQASPLPTSPSSNSQSKLNKREQAHYCFNFDRNNPQVIESQRIPNRTVSAKALRLMGIDPTKK